MTEQIKNAIRRSVTQPLLWVLIGTTLPPMNVFWAVGFWVVAILRRSAGASLCARCLNIQLTYTLILGLPFLLGGWVSKIPSMQAQFAPGSQHALIMGVALGLVSAGGVLLLVFFNTRLLAQSLLQHKFSATPRVRFVRE